jgi:hypothetical protein
MTSRRSFLLAAAALWQSSRLLAYQHRHELEPGHSQDPYRFLFLDDVQRGTLRSLLSRIVPSDERSAGAVGANVDQYIDFVLSHADDTTKNLWRNGLSSYGAAIDGKPGDGIDLFLEEQSQHEFAPNTAEQTFFVLLKTAAVEGFYTSEEGIDHELGYKGMTFALEFNGCTHPQHVAPEGWRPGLRQPEDGA